MAAHQPGVWGIDLGQCALKAIRLEMKDGEVLATAFEYIEHPKILNQPDADPDEMTKQALTQFLSRNNIRGDLIAIGVPGQSGLARFVKLPPVAQKKVAEIVKFEAKQQIPFPLDEVVWDFQALSTGEVVDGMALETEIGLFAIKRDMVTRAIQHFKEVNVEVHLVQMAPLSLCNFVSYDLLGKDTNSAAEEEEDHSCIVALEIGTDNSNLVITDGGRIIWQRPIPIGGNHFTRALTKELKLTFAKAEHLKRNAAKSPDLKKILQALKQVLNDFVGEVQRSLGYFTNTHRNAQLLYMIGLGNAFRLPGLQKFLQEKLQLEVRKLTGLERASGESVTAAPTFAENIMSFGVAYGLAAQGLKQAKLQTNLLPYEVRLERIVRGKKPWAVLAAACLLFGLCMLHFARAKERANAGNDEITRRTAKAQEVAKIAKGYNAAYIEAQAKLDKQLASLNRIGAGVRERFNWQLLHAYVNFASPQPNGEKLVEKASTLQRVKEEYWDKNPNAKKAWEMLERKRLGITENLKVDEAQKQEAFMKQHLIQVNIAGINALYSEDLGPFYAKIHQDGNNLPGMTPEERTSVLAYLNLVNQNDPGAADKMKELNLPREGWIVEVRGYTYRDQGQRFIVATIAENLRFPSQLKDLKGKDFVMPPGWKEVVESKVSYFHIYSMVTVNNPVAGEFKVIGKSYLKTLVRGIGGAAPKLNRDGWRPAGETAGAIWGEHVPPAVGADFQPQLPAGDPKAAVNVPRTEFVLVFVWREPLSTQTPPAPAAKN